MRNGCPMLIVLGLAAVLDLLSAARADDGSQAWLRYETLPQERVRNTSMQRIVVQSDSDVLQSAGRELQQGLGEILGRQLPIVTGADPAAGDLVLIDEFGAADEPPQPALQVEAESLGPEGFVVRAAGDRVFIAANSDRGALYGAFALLREVQLGRSIEKLDLQQRPQMPLRLINQWDNLDGTIERGYAGQSIFWGSGVQYPDTRHTAYARLLASVGINGICINNVNVGKGTNVQILSPQYLQKVAAIAGAFREYGVRIYLSAGFDSPRSLGGLKTADPLDPQVRQWWRDKVEEIYRHVPDFGGFVVKADSEGQPGPYVFGRNHAEGANMLAEALRPHGGIVMWRAFVYDAKGTDRAAMASQNFLPLDGHFADNVLVQIKNGPIDFQVREPVHPLFGALPQTRAMLELQITQEYTGHDVHLCFLVPMWKQVLDFDTHASGSGSTVTGVIDGSVHGPSGGITAVANVGQQSNWLGHHLHMANLYGYGRLAWDPQLEARDIAQEWVQLTFGTDPVVIKTIVSMLMDSWGIYESYTSPMGLGVLHDTGAHFNPAPHIRYPYHKAGSKGIGFDRTRATGSGYVDLYHPPVARMYESLATCPQELLLFFHHLPYTHRLPNDKTLIQQLYDSYHDGVEQAQELRRRWAAVEGRIDDDSHRHVLDRLTRQVEHAGRWRDTMTLFLFQLSGIADEKKRVRSDYRLRHLEEMR